MLDAEQIRALCPGWPDDSGAPATQRKDEREPNKAAVPASGQQTGSTDT